MRRLLMVSIIATGFVINGLAAEELSNAFGATANQTQPNNAGSLTVDNSDIGVSIDSEQSALNSSFEHIAELGQQIEVANKEIEAADLQKKLDKINSDRNQKNLGFKIYQILGFDKDLFATLIGDNGSMYVLSPGEMVNDQYRIVLITPSTVKVVDVDSDEVYSVPFNQPVFDKTKQKSSGLSSEMANNSSVQMTVPDTQPTTTVAKK